MCSLASRYPKIGTADFKVAVFLGVLHTGWLSLSCLCRESSGAVNGTTFRAGLAARAGFWLWQLSR